MMTQEERDAMDAEWAVGAVGRAKKEKIAQLKCFRDCTDNTHRVLMFSGAAEDWTSPMPVKVRDLALNGINSLRERMSINGISEIDWYFDDGDDESQRTCKTLTSGDVNQLLKQLVTRDEDNRLMYHKKEAEIFALTTVEAVNNYDIECACSDSTNWPS